MGAPQHRGSRAQASRAGAQGSAILTLRLWRWKAEASVSLHPEHPLIHFQVSSDGSSWNSTLPTLPPITSMCPLSRSVIWSLGKHSPPGLWRMPAFFRWSVKLDQHLHYSRPWLFRCFKPLFIPMWGWTAFNTLYAPK